MPPKSVGTLGAGTLYVQKSDGSYEKFMDVNESWDNVISTVALDETQQPEQEVVFDAEFGGEKVFEASIEIKPPVIIDGEYKEVE